MPAIEGLVPTAPVIDQSNFKVVQINKQVTDSTPIKVVNDKLAMKSSIKSEINQLDESINQSKLQLNTGFSAINEGSLQLTNVNSSPILGSNLSPVSVTGQKTTPIGVNVEAVKANLSSLIQERVKKVELYSSLVSEVNTLS